MKKLFLLGLCVLSISTYAQMECFTVDTSSSTSATQCGDKIDYAPVEGYEYHIPMKTVRINVHFMLKEDSLNPSSFTETDDGLGYAYTGYDYANQLETQLNYHLSVNEQMNLPYGNTTPNPDVRIKVKLMGVYFHRIDSLYTYHPDKRPTMINNLAVNPSSEMNIFYQNGPTNGPNASGVSGFGAQPHPFIYSPWENYVAAGGNGTNNTWSISGITCHEIFHNFDLFHHTIQNGCGKDSLGNDIVIDSTKNDLCDDTPSIYDLINTYGISNPCGFDANDSTKSNNMMDYNNSQRALTPCQLGRAHTELYDDLLPYLLDDYCDLDTNKNIRIYNGETFTWNSTRYLHGNLIIKSGGQLTIKCTVGLPQDGKVIVEPGGKLIIDGGTLTNPCSEMWAGIEVQGTSNTSQLTSGAQGTVELKNAAVIENAWNAITTIKTDGSGNWDWTGTGGIIRANNATFRNNWRDIQMLSYHNKHPSTGAAMNNVSYFYNCTFTTTALLNEATSKPIAHVTLFDLDGLRFYGCKFIYSAGAAYQTYERRTGIKSIDARYTVTCLKSIDTGNCISGGDSKFDGLYYGIEAQNSVQSQTITVNNTTFDQTQFGILLRGVNYATITENTFEPANGGWGIYAQQSSDYEIEENTFNGESGSAIGTYHYFNGVRDNKVYRNTFSSFDYASMMSSTNGTGISKGLEYNCNTYNTTDVVDIGIASGKTRKVWGTLSSNPAHGANNLFSYNASLGDIFANNWVTSFTYSFVDDNSYNLEPRSGYYNPTVTTLHGINGTFNSSTYCPSELAATKSKAEIKSTISALRTSRDSVANIIDGGKKAMMLEMIENDDPEGDIQDTLLTYSPYLSDEVLLAAIQDVPSPLSSDILKNILEANSPLSEAIWDSAQTRDPAMEGADIDYLSDFQTGNSPRDTLEMIISLHQGEVELATNDLIRHFLNDTNITSHYDSVKVAILLDPNRQHADLEYTEILIAQADSSSLDSLTSISGNYTSWSDYLDYLEDAFSLKANPSLSQDSAFLASMPSRAIDGVGSYEAKECAYAQAILENFDTLNYPEIIEELYALERKGNIPDEPQLSGYVSPIVFDAYPNPYNQRTEINYLLPENAIQPQLMVVEMASGKLVKSYQLAENKGKVSISGQELSNGVYLYYITTSNGRSKVKKLVKTN